MSASCKARVRSQANPGIQVEVEVEGQPTGALEMLCLNKTKP